MDKVHVLNKLYEYGGFNTKAEFADFLDLSPQNLSNWYNRKTFDINLLSNKFTNVNRNWLLTGEGEMLRSDNPIKEQSKEDRLLSIIESQQRTIENLSKK